MLYGLSEVYTYIKTYIAYACNNNNWQRNHDCEGEGERGVER